MVSVAISCATKHQARLVRGRSAGRPRPAAAPPCIRPGRAIQFGDRPRRHQLAVLEHGDFVGDAKDLFQPMRDVYHGDALRFQRFDDAKELIQFAAGQDRGGFIHDDEIGVLRKRFGDLHQLLLRDGQFADGQVQIELDAQPIEQRAGLRSCSASSPRRRGACAAPARERYSRRPTSAAPAPAPDK